LQNNINSW